MSDTIQSLRRQLAEAEENLRLILERKAEYVLDVDVPLQLIKNERRLEVEITGLRERLIELAQAQLDADMDELRARRDQADKTRREIRERQQVVNLRPLDVTDTFRDRVREMQQLCQHLTDRSARLISVVGRGGMGKTALVSRVLGDLERGVLPIPDEEREFSVDGILYLSTRHTGVSLERIYADVGRMLGEPDASGLAAQWTSDASLTAKVEYLLEVTRDGIYLILLDNLEDSLADDGSIGEEGLRLLVERCLIQPGGIRLIVTSREQVKIAVAALRSARSIHLREGLPEDEAVALLRDLDPQGELGLHDTSEDDLRRAVQLTQGIPRALEILAGILYEDSTITLAELLEDEQLFGEQVVEQLVAEGYQRLGQDEQRIMEALAVFDRPVEETAIAYLLHPWFPGLDVQAGLRRLAQGYFVNVNRITDEYSPHPLDRQHSYDQVPEEGGADAYTQRNLELRAAEFYAGIRKPEIEWKTIHDLIPQLAEFEHRVRAGDYDNACRTLDPIDSDYLSLWGYYARLVELREGLAGQLTEADLQTGNLSRLGYIYHALGQYERAIQFHEQALVMARQIGQRQVEGSILGNLGREHRALGQYERAMQLYEESLAIARETGDRQREASQLGRLGWAYRILGQIERAIELYEEALTVAREIGNRQQEGYHLGCLGIAYADLGQADQAIELQEQALAIAQEVQDRRSEGVWPGYIGLVYHGLGRTERAIELYTVALTITHEIGYRLGESYQLVWLGKSLLTIGEPPEAQRCLEDALALDLPRTSYQAALGLSIALLHQHDPAAVAAFEDTIVRCQAMLDKTADLYTPRYTLATALVGRAVNDPHWAQPESRAELLAPALAEYRRALENCAAPGAVGLALRDLELIPAVGIEGLEPVLELLKSASS
jgi:tetratricopeptide (TPR) repeat protein